jgi:hypothetical protein
MSNPSKQTKSDKTNEKNNTNAKDSSVNTTDGTPSSKPRDMNPLLEAKKAKAEKRAQQTALRKEQMSLLRNRRHNRQEKDDESSSTESEEKDDASALGNHQRRDRDRNYKATTTIKTKATKKEITTKDQTKSQPNQSEGQLSK